MGRFVAIYGDYAAAGSVAGGSFLGTMPLANAQTPDPGEVARTINASPASSTFVVNIGSSSPVGGIAVTNGNFSYGATYAITGSNSSAFTSLVYDSGVVPIPGASDDWPELVCFAAILPTDQSAQFWRIAISDPSNPAGYVQFGRVIVGRAFRPSINYEYGAEFSHEPIYRRVTSVGGAQWDWDLNRRRGLRVNFGNLAESELFDDVDRMRRICGASGHVFVYPDPDDTNRFQRRSFLATLKSPPPIVQASFQLGTTAIDCEEVL